MRIIAGSAKGHTLKSPKGMDTRPTQDRVRESIFNVLHSRFGLFDKLVLDLFSGTGALAIEALSRGAQEAVAVDHRTSKIILDNAKHCKVDQQLQVYACSLAQVSPRLEGRQFDLIFSDPPYEQGWIEKTMAFVVQYNLLSDTGVLVVERHKNEPLELPESWEVVKELSFGYTRVDICVPHQSERR